MGYRFYYWQKYKEFKTLPIEETDDSNINDHGGYDVCELFVVRKYENFKEEIMSYANITIENYQTIIAKAREHEQTKNVKQIKAYEQWNASDGILHYEAAANTI